MRTAREKIVCCENGGFVPWNEWEPILHGLNCPCCMGVYLMPDEEELEQRINEFIQKGFKETEEALDVVLKGSKERVRNAILSLEIEQMNKSLEQTKAVMNN